MNRLQLNDNWEDLKIVTARNAELRVYDTCSKWECYILAQNPFEEDEIICIINADSLELCRWRWSSIHSMFNEHGETPKIDRHFRPCTVDQIIKNNPGKPWIETELE